VTNHGEVSAFPVYQSMT